MADILFRVRDRERPLLIAAGSGIDPTVDPKEPGEGIERRVEVLRPRGEVGDRCARTEQGDPLTADPNRATGDPMARHRIGHPLEQDRLQRGEMAIGIWGEHALHRGASDRHRQWVTGEGADMTDAAGVDLGGKIGTHPDRTGR